MNKKAAREVAERVGSPYGTILATTPGKLNNKDGRFAYKLYNSALRWSELFYDQEDLDSLNNLVQKNSRDTNLELILLEFNHRQLGKTDKWLYKRMKVALSEGENAESDYLMKWVGGGSDSPIGKAELEIIKGSVDIKPRTEVTNYGYVIRWYKPQIEIDKMLKDGFLVMGVDTSDAVSKDGISVIFRYSKTGEVVGAGDYNETNLTIFSDFLADLLIKYDGLIAIIERRSSAVVIIDNIITILHARGINPFKKLFNWIYNDKEKWGGKDAEALFSTRTPDFDLLTKYRKYIGFATSGSGRTSRAGLYGNTFNSSIKFTGSKTRDSLLVHQLSSLVIKNGRIDHMDGEHDDAVVGWLLGYWFLTNGRHKETYDLLNVGVLEDVVNLELMANSNGAGEKDIKQQEALRKEINIHIKKLHSETNPQIALRSYTMIRMLEKKVDYKIVKNFNIESLLKEIKILKKLKMVTA